MGRTVLGHSGWQLKQCPHKDYDSSIAGLMTEGRLKGWPAPGVLKSPFLQDCLERTMLSRSTYLRQEGHLRGPLRRERRVTDLLGEVYLDTPERT